MKNLKIGAKIFLGFAVVIILMAVITGTVAISSSSTIKNLGDIEADSVLQTKGTELVNTFYTAQLNVKIISYIINDEAYAEAVKNLSLCEEIINDMSGHINQNPILEKFRPQLNEMETLLATYSNNTAQLQQSNMAIYSLMEEIEELGITLTELSDRMDSSHITILYDSTALDLTPDERIIQMNNLTDGALISQGIWNMRKNADVMIGMRSDYANYESDFEWIDNTMSLAKGSKSTSSQISEIRTNLPAYMDLIASFRNEMYHNKAVSENLVANGIILIDGLSNMMSAIDEVMVTQVENTAVTARNYRTAAMAVSVVSIIIAACIALFIGKSITKPINVMVSAADSIAVGDTNVEVEYNSKDEIGKLTVSFKRMVNAIREQVLAVESIANGDLSVEIKLRGQEDKMGAALMKMVENLSNMFSEIRASSIQVSAGSKQIADGAQTLAQGSTQQAASLEELSISISEIAQKTKEDAEATKKLAVLAGMAGLNAETGSQQMEQMIEAVQDINHASNNIRKIIKVIDDIAFQTNILALNAAVEAARAGQHGKGFAVVAEEVRNLAAKSASAANETEGLIADSMKKAQLGSKIAEKTSASLADIVTGVREAGLLMEEIVKSSEAQSAAIVQINTGVDQVAQVVQQNSTTAQESAAASQEMSGQSGILEELISRFKLKDAGPFAPSREKVLAAPRESGFSLASYSEEYGKY